MEPMSGLKDKRLIVVVGPTAIGKTQVSIELAKALNTEILSADSRQVFVEMSIGTAKPSPTELAAIKHHFIDYRSIREGYDAGQYERDGLRLLEQLFEKQDQLILCGGSGMYIKALCEGFDEMPDVPDSIRQEVISEYKQNGLAWLQEQVAKNDPDYFAEMDQKNPQRLMRALELIMTTGRPASEFRQRRRKSRPFEIIKIGLDTNREELYRRIEKRVDGMITMGLVEEAKSLYEYRDYIALQTVGYQELFGFFQHQYDFNEAVRLLKRNTRRYAKRQLTWFRKDSEIKWFGPGQLKEILEYIDAK